MNAWLNFFAHLTASEWLLIVGVLLFIVALCLWSEDSRLKKEKARKEEEKSHESE